MPVETLSQVEYRNINNLDYCILRSKVEGSKFSITAGVHGDETSPQVTARRIIENATNKGTLTVIPSLNVESTILRSHGSPDNKIADYNRNFHNHDQHELLNDLLTIIKENSEFHIDLHAHQYTQTIPYVVQFEYQPSNYVDLRAYNSAYKLGVKYIERVSVRDNYNRIQGTLVHNLRNLDIPSLVVEVSPSNLDIAQLAAQLANFPHDYCELIPVTRYTSTADLLIDEVFFNLGDNISPGDRLFSYYQVNSINPRNYYISQGGGTAVTLPVAGQFYRKGFSITRVAHE